MPRVGRKQIAMSFTGNYVYEKLHTEEFSHSKESFMAEAAHAIAVEMIANGSVLVNSNYDIRTGMYQTSAYVLCARRVRDLP